MRKIRSRVAHVDQHRQPSLAKLIHLQIAVVVDLEILHIRMKLHSAKPERDKLLEIPLEILAVRMERAEADEFSARLFDLARNVPVYRAHLLCGDRHRLNEIAVDPRAVPLLEEALNGSVERHRDRVKLARVRRCRRRYLRRIDVAVRVDYLKSVFHPLAFLSAGAYAVSISAAFRSP